MKDERIRPGLYERDNESMSRGMGNVHQCKGGVTSAESVSTHHRRTTTKYHESIYVNESVPKPRRSPQEIRSSVVLTNKTDIADVLDVSYQDDGTIRVQAGGLLDGDVPENYHSPQQGIHFTQARQAQQWAIYRRSWRLPCSSRVYRDYNSALRDAVPPNLGFPTTATPTYSDGLPALRFGLQVNQDLSRCLLKGFNLQVMEETRVAQV